MPHKSLNAHLKENIAVWFYQNNHDYSLFFLCVSYYPTLPYNSDLQFGKNVTAWFESFDWLMRKLFLLCCLLHPGIIAAHRAYQNWRNLRHYRHQGWRKSIRGKWEGIRSNYQCQPARTLQESIYVTTSTETLPLVNIVLKGEMRSTLYPTLVLPCISTLKKYF